MPRTTTQRLATARRMGQRAFKRGDQYFSNPFKFTFEPGRRVEPESNLLNFAWADAWIAAERESRSSPEKRCVAVGRCGPDFDVQEAA
jgi:hypothetical protein